MRLWEIIIVSVGLSLDAFTIAVCRGSTQGKLNKLTATLVGIIWFNSNIDVSCWNDYCNIPYVKYTK